MLLGFLRKPGPDQPESLRRYRTTPPAQVLPDTGDPALQTVLYASPPLFHYAWEVSRSHDERVKALFRVPPREKGLRLCRALLLWCRSSCSDASTPVDARLYRLGDFIEACMIEHTFELDAATLAILIEEVFAIGLTMADMELRWFRTMIERAMASPGFAPDAPLRRAATSALVVLEGAPDDVVTSTLVDIGRHLVTLAGVSHSASRLLRIDAEAKRKAEAIRIRIEALVDQQLAPWLPGPDRVAAHVSVWTSDLLKQPAAETADLILRILNLFALVRDLEPYGQSGGNDPFPARLGHLPEYKPIAELAGALFKLARRPARFTPANAVAVIDRIDRPYAVALARNLARALSPDTPGALQAVERFAARAALTDADDHKALSRLKAAVAPSQSDASAAPADILAKVKADALAHLDARLAEWRRNAMADGPLAIDRICLAVFEAVRLGALEPARTRTILGELKAAQHAKSIVFDHSIEVALDLIGTLEKRVAVYDNLTPEHRALIVRLETFADAAPKAARPSSAWLKTARSQLELNEWDVAYVALPQFLREVALSQQEAWCSSGEAYQRALYGLAWIMAEAPPEVAAATLHDFARRCFATVPGVGILAEKAGNAAIWGLTALPQGRGAAHLARLATSIRYPKVRKKIELAMFEAAASAGLSRAELDEMIVPTHDLSNGERVLTGEHGAAVICVTERGKVELDWRTTSGKPVKSPPQAMRTAGSGLVKTARALHKEIAADFSVQMRRLERLPHIDRIIAANAWLQHYIEHPLIGSACRSLIWSVHKDDAIRDGIWTDGRLIDLEGNVIDLRDATVSLWHPVLAQPDSVVAWRDLLQDQGIVQPIRQAWREVYVPTDAERATRTYSNRFAGHILRQHQMMALAHDNGWKCTHRVWFDTPNDEPSWIALPAHGVYAEYWTEGAGGADPEVLASGAHVYLSTDRVAFFALAGDPLRQGPAALRGAPMEVDRVPPVAFSEIMRCCDLFVGVASIANDPTWQDGGADAAHPSYWHREVAGVYWNLASTGELAASAKLRRAALERILPWLKIADRLRIEDRYVRVEGVRRCYRVHIGSAAVQREPDSRNVCIVRSPQTATSRIELPFEGDATLSLILSKIMMLARDDEITDPIILAQIRN